MILTIDIGNTNKKYSLFLNETLIQQKEWEEVEQIPPYDLAVISNVSNQELNLPDGVSLSQLFYDQKFLDMPVNYEQTLGEDRLATSYFLYKTSKYPTAVIDAGTFTTIDFVDPSGYQGGVILPGVELIQNAYTQGANLQPYPLIDYDSNELPNNTQQAIQAGTYLSTIAAIKTLLKEQNISSLYITGGHGQKILNLLEKDLEIPVLYESNLIHLGLNKIAQELK